MSSTSPPGRMRFWPLFVVLFVPALFFWPAARVEATAPETRRVQALTLADWPLDEVEARGRIVYDQYCVGCHGAEGLGDGAAAVDLSPRPRNFQVGYFKFRSTPGGSLPLVEDLVRTITCGLPGSAMPGFPLVPETDRRAVATYVRGLALLRWANIEAETKLQRAQDRDAFVRDEVPAIKRDVERTMIDSLRPVGVPAFGDPTPESIAKGKAFFATLCAKCHGDTGRGDGPSSFTQRDWKDEAVPVRDFSLGIFRAGSSPRDLYLRIRTGLDGTSMGATTGGSDEEIIGVVHYVRSLVDPAAVPPRLPPGCDHQEKQR